MFLASCKRASGGGSGLAHVPILVAPEIYGASSLLERLSIYMNSFDKDYIERLCNSKYLYTSDRISSIRTRLNEKRNTLIDQYIENYTPRKSFWPFSKREKFSREEANKRVVGSRDWHYKSFWDRMELSKLQDEINFIDNLRHIMMNCQGQIHLSNDDFQRLTKNIL